MIATRAGSAICSPIAQSTASIRSCMCPDRRRVRDWVPLIANVKGLQSFETAAIRGSVKQGIGGFCRMIKKFRVVLALIGLAACAPPPPTTSAPVSGVQVGVLTCNVAGGFGFVFGSSRSVNCTLAPAGGGPPQHYAGSIDRFGVDIGYLQGGVLIWTVFAPTANLAPGSLAGRYGGVTGSATVGVGLGANVLVGGSANSIALQPVSIQGTTGLNVAAGIAAMTLTYQPG